MPWPCDFFGAQKDALAAEPKADAGALPSCGPSGACDAVPQLLRCEPRGAGCRGSGIRRPLRAVDNTVHPDRTCAPAGRSTDRATCTPAAAGRARHLPRRGRPRPRKAQPVPSLAIVRKGALLPPGGPVGLGSGGAPCLCALARRSGSSRSRAAIADSLIAAGALDASCAARPSGAAAD